ncbi:hypothetical protein SEA_ANON_79 [Gordonia phage Anon]|nr:hypothetical protein SEA_ANON_79 [Gordonia phage Anon]
MPITRLMSRFAGIQHDAEQVVAEEDGFLFAQKCRVWHIDEPDNAVELLLVYRSLIVEEFDEVYAPVSALKLNAEKITTLFEHEQEDVELMFGTGVLTLFSLSAASLRLAQSPESNVRQILAQSIEGEPVL